MSSRYQPNISPVQSYKISLIVTSVISGRRTPFTNSTGVITMDAGLAFRIPTMIERRLKMVGNLWTNVSSLPRISLNISSKLVMI